MLPGPSPQKIASCERAEDKNEFPDAKGTETLNCEEKGRNKKVAK